MNNQKLRKTILGCLIITFVFVNFYAFTSILFVHTQYLESSTKDNPLSASVSSPSKNVTKSTIRTVKTRPAIKNSKDESSRTPANNYDNRSKSQDRLQTLERLKNVLDINDTVTLLRQIQYSKSDINNNIPLWSDIEQRYGSNFPHIIGLDRCSDFQQLLMASSSSSTASAWIGPAGLFHSGTNLIAKLLVGTCNTVSTTTTVHGQVPYGKHNPVQAATDDKYRIPTNPVYSEDAPTNMSHIFPIVMVRHPLDWLRSMCRQRFTVSWNKTNTTGTKSTLPCPSLNTSISVDLYQNFYYDNILELWKQWYYDYYQYTHGPRLIVRLEDLVYSPRETLQQICYCIGGNFIYDSTILQSREGGVVREEQNKDHFLVKAWNRHAKVDVTTSLSSSIENQKLFREIVSTTDLKDLLEVFHYQIVS